MNSCRGSAVWRRALCSAALGALAMAPAFADAHAQEAVAGKGDGAGFEEIVVTAGRREEKLMSVPQSISALTDARLAELGADNFSDYARFVPGLDFVEFAPGQTRITLRGVSAEVGASTVSYYIDEISITSGDQSAQPDFKMFDIERVEVLRGPQGTLYGEGSMGGTIKVITRKPDATEFAGAIDMTAGTIRTGGEEYAVSGMLNVPIVTDKLAVRAVGMYRNSDGWIDNVLPGSEQKDTNSSEIYGVRVAVRFTPTENLTFTGTSIFNRLRTDNNNVVNRGADIATPALSPRDDDYDLYGLTVDYEFPGVTLTSATSYSKRDTAIRLTDSVAALDYFNSVFGPITGGAYTITGSLVFLADQGKSFTQEVRLVSDNDSRFSWTVGGFYRDAKGTSSVYRVTTPDFTFGPGNLLGATPGDVVPGGIYTSATRVKTEDIAIFGEATYRLTDAIEVTGGLRWFQEKQNFVGATSGALVFDPGTGSFVQPDVLDNNKIDDMTPKATISYTPNQNALIFFTAARGYRAGGVNLLADILPAAQNRYKNDATMNYELGGKFTFADGRITLTGAVYYIDWSDLQVTDFDATLGIGYISNAGSAHSMGAELELLAKPTDRLTLSLSGNITEAELDSDVPGANFAVDGSVIEKGTRLPDIPRYKFGATAQYVYPLSSTLNLVLHGDASFVGNSYSRLEAGVNEALGLGNSKQPAYAIGNLRAGIEAERWSATLFINNVWDEFAALGDDNFGGFHRNQPRTLGINLKYDF
jgi:iron complex outermembrane receptor protein